MSSLTPDIIAVASLPTRTCRDFMSELELLRYTLPILNHGLNDSETNKMDHRQTTQTNMQPIDKVTKVTPPEDHAIRNGETIVLSW